MSEIENVLKVFLEYAANTTSEATLDIDVYQGNIQTLRVTVMEPKEEKEVDEVDKAKDFERGKTIYDPYFDRQFIVNDDEVRRMIEKNRNSEE